MKFSPKFSAFISKTGKNILKIKHASCHLGFNISGLFILNFSLAQEKALSRQDGPAACPDGPWQCTMQRQQETDQAVRAEEGNGLRGVSHS